MSARNHIMSLRARSVLVLDKRQQAPERARKQEEQRVDADDKHCIQRGERVRGVVGVSDARKNDGARHEPE